MAKRVGKVPMTNGQAKIGHAGNGRANGHGRDGHAGNGRAVNGYVGTGQAENCGPDARRRLSEKILAAFTHAYAIGETELAEQLRALLQRNSAKMGAEGLDWTEGGLDPVDQADLWVRFVEARNRYKSTSEGETAAAQEALEAMKQAYREWSLT